MINPHQFVNLILGPALKALDMYSIDAMFLMVCTAMVESKLTHIQQLPLGPALGLMQVEPYTYADIKRYLYTRDDIHEAILSHCQYKVLPKSRALISDIAFNVMIARVKYWMQPEPIPSWKDRKAQADYYKKYYNCNPNINKELEFIKHSESIWGWIQELDDAPLT